MKKFDIWRIIAIFLFGCLLGFGSGAYTLTKVIIKSNPQGVVINIGKMKVRGENNTFSPNIQQTEPKNKKHKLFRK